MGIKHHKWGIKQHFIIAGELEGTPVSKMKFSNINEQNKLKLSWHSKLRLCIESSYLSLDSEKCRIQTGWGKYHGMVHTAKQQGGECCSLIIQVSD